MFYTLQFASRDKKSLTASLESIAGIAALTGLSWISFASPAAAHHAMDGRLPTNWLEGFLSGLAHPVISIDHFAFVVAIGLLCAKQQRGALILAAFILSALVGTMLHLFQLDLPIVELAIAGSVVGLGALLLAAQPVSWLLLTALGIAAGVFHGYAYGEAIIGAEMTPLLAYLTGFSLMQYGVAWGALWLGRSVAHRSAAQFVAIARFAGLAIGAIGLLFLSKAAGVG